MEHKVTKRFVDAGATRVIRNPARAGLLETLKDPKVAASCCFLVTIGFMAWLWHLSTNRILSTTEAIALQLFSVLASIGGSYLFSSNRRSIPGARSAFRRLFSLFRGLSNIRDEVWADNDDSDKVLVIRALVETHLATVDDALSDWEDIVPEEVRDIKEKIREQNA